MLTDITRLTVLSFILIVVIWKSRKLLFNAGGGLSDRGYNSMSSEDARRIVAAISSTDTRDVAPVIDCRADGAGDLRALFVVTRNIKDV